MVLFSSKVDNRILYIDQSAFIPRGQSVQYFFTSVFPEGPPDGFEKSLYQISYDLGIENLVNEKTMSKCFKKPSGGEIKRLILLRHIFPILMNVSNVQIAFLDEVSAGLDKETVLKVRKLIEQLKDKGITVISIDHIDDIDYSVDLEVEIHKTVLPLIKSTSTKKKLPFWKTIFSSRYIQFDEKYEDEDEDLEIQYVFSAPLLDLEDEQNEDI